MCFELLFVFAFVGVLFTLKFCFSNRKMEFELQEMTKEGKELAKTKNDTMRADGQREEK